MSSRRDWLLQQMGITQYKLRRPRALQGEVAVSLPAGVRLLVVAEVPPGARDPLVNDILRSLEIAEQTVVFLTPDQLAMLPAGIVCATWLLGAEAEISLSGPQLKSPPLEALYHDASARRALWQQICEHDVDFFTHAE
ncbi:DNA polymerase III subunit psi [Paramixta manurensis]|uniref:DNA polymerase III subunit psi n=1 Tax=Paramixta manurensis TaxID=2740817 RepID=A0A6M8UDF4_9GAMM|nr:DNA polymerase III subunit psi [Erwiniaceae bacterium PD-1]